MAQEKQKTNAVKILIYWLVLWLVMLLLQLAIVIAESASLDPRIVTLLTTLYQVDFYFNWFASVYIAIMFIYNAALYLSGTSKTGK